MSDKIVVIGAGVAGLSLAIMLAKKNISCVVVESRDTFDEITTGVRVSAEGTKILSSIGVECVGQVTNEVIMHSGSFVSNFSCAKEGCPPAVIATRLAIFEQLKGKVKSFNIPVHYGFKVVSIDETGAGVTVIAENSDTIEGKIVIGADGVGSLVRKLLNPTLPSTKNYAGYLGLGFITEYDKCTEMNLYHYPGHRMGVASCGKVSEKSTHKSVFVWTHMHMSEDAAKVISKQEVLNELDSRSSVWGPELQQIYADFKKDSKATFAFWPIYNGTPPLTWYNEKMMLIGDAAHPYGPGAQGITMALKDAQLLCEVISNGFTSKDKEEFRIAREQETKAIGEAAETRNTTLTQSEFALFWQGLFLKTYHLFTCGRIHM